MHTFDDTRIDYFQPANANVLAFWTMQESHNVQLVGFVVVSLFGTQPKIRRQK